MNSALRWALALSLCLPGAAAQAHHLWLEQAGQGLQISFGEFGENLREASPGNLDKLEPRAKAQSATATVGAGATERPLTVAKTANGFTVSGKIESSDSIVAEDVRYPVFVRTKDGTTTRSIYLPAARLVPDRTARTPLLDLDIVPAGGDAFKVTYKGQPLPKAKVEVITNAGWGRELHTDDKGEFSVGLPWRGPYVFEVQHADKTPGKRGEEAYDVVNYVTSLTFGQPDGLEPLPALPAAKPH
jgi:Domain of unknown function (DUF4198)